VFISVQHSAHGFGRLSPHLVQQLLPHPSPSLLDLRSSSILRHRHSRVHSEDLVNPLPPKTLNPNPKLFEAHLLYSEKGRSQLFFFFFSFFLFLLGYLSQFSTLENFKRKKPEII
jgi:hypothetical protein